MGRSGRAPTVAHSAWADHDLTVESDVFGALRVRPTTESDAEEIAAWRYDVPWSVYDVTAADLRSELADYRTVVAAARGEVVGFYCTGPAARVAGLSVEDQTIDLGVGLRPDLVGRGMGQQFARAVLDDLRQNRGARRVRVVVQSWNERSARLALSMGLVVVGSHQCVQAGKPVDYTVLVAPIDALRA